MKQYLLLLHGMYSDIFFELMIANHSLKSAGLEY